MAVYCPTCGASAADDARFCRSCGAGLTPTATSATTGASAPETWAASAADVQVRPGYLASNVATLDPSAPAGLGPVVYAGFWRRFAAAFIDGIMVYIIGFVAGAILGVVLSVAQVSSDSIAFAGGLAGFAIGVLYYPLQESAEVQATLGKRAMGIKVTDEHGRRISFMRALARTLAKWISAIILLIGYIMAAFTERKQALHDIIAGTLVVRSRA